MAKSVENCVPNTPMCFIFEIFLLKALFGILKQLVTPKTLVFGYNVSSSICGGITWTFFSCHVSGSNCN